jgi:hypothetical protein
MRDNIDRISVVTPLIRAPIANDISVSVNQNSRVHINLSIGTVSYCTAYSTLTTRRQSREYPGPSRYLPGPFSILLCHFTHRRYRELRLRNTATHAFLQGAPQTSAPPYFIPNAIIVLLSRVFVQASPCYSPLYRLFLY